MSLSRRKFLSLTTKSVCLIGTGNLLRFFAPGTFALPPAEEVLHRFAIVSDGHYGQPDTPFAAAHDQMKNWLNTEGANRRLDFTFINGDLFHNDASFLPQVKNVWDQLHMPYYVSRGNHDMTDESTWKKYFNQPLNYGFEQHDAAFLVLDTVDDKGNYVCPDLQFTATQLLQYQHKKQLFVFMHITPFNWTKGGNPCPQLAAQFSKQSNLKAVFHGHDHDQDGVKIFERKNYFFDSHIAGNWGTDYKGYRIVEVLKNGHVLTYQVNPLQQEPVNNTKL